MVVSAWLVYRLWWWFRPPLDPRAELQAHRLHTAMTHMNGLCGLSRPMPRILGPEEGLPCLISRARFPASRAFVT
jgi:hypothetical protein